MRGLAFAGALLVFAVWAEAASACSCVRAHPAGQLAFAPAALVGVVEEVSTGNGGSSHVIRVERSIKGDLPERVTVASATTSCMVTLERGARVGLLLYGSPGAWDTNACSTADPDALIAAAALPRPGGAGRFVAAVDASGVDAVALGANGRPAGYGLPQDTPVAVARCASGVIQAARGDDGKVRVFSRSVPRLDGSGPVVLPLRDVSALGCTEGGRVLWAIGDDRGQQLLLEIRDGKVRPYMRRAATAVAIVGSHAYYAHPGGLFRVLPLTGGRGLHAFRHEGEFAQISVSGNRIVGRLRDGRGAVLYLGSGRLVTGEAAGPLVWLTRNRVLDAKAGAILDARLRPIRRVTVGGDLLAVEGGAAYFGDGKLVRRLAPGGSRLTRFAELPGKVVALTSVRATAGATWHSCVKSAKLPLTT